MTLRITVAVCALAVLCAWPVYAAPSGLILIPTAEVLDSGGLNLDLQSASADIPTGDTLDDYMESEYGIGGNFEFGVDTSLNSLGTWVNAKYRILKETKRHPALAVGIQNVGTGSDDQPYVVGFRSFAKAKVHAGAIVSDHRTRAMAGLDWEITEVIGLQADYTSGSSNFASIGVEADLTDRWTLIVARLIGNSSETKSGYLFSFGWTGKF